MTTKLLKDKSIETLFDTSNDESKCKKDNTMLSMVPDELESFMYDYDIFEYYRTIYLRLCSILMKLEEAMDDRIGGDLRASHEYEQIIKKINPSFTTIGYLKEAAIAKVVDNLLSTAHPELGSLDEVTFYNIDKISNEAEASLSNYCMTEVDPPDEIIDFENFIEAIIGGVTKP